MTGPGKKGRGTGAKRQRAKALVAQPDKAGRTQLRPAILSAFCRDKQDVFFATLAETCNVRMSADHAGVSQQTIWRWRRKDPEFARRFDTVRADAHADLEMRLMAVAREGVTGEQWDEVDADGKKRRRFRRDAPDTMRFLVSRHQAAVEATAPDQEDVARAARETLDELIDRLSQRLGEIEAEEAAVRGAQG